MRLAFVVVAGDAHDVATVAGSGRDQFDQFLAHAFGVVLIVTEHDGFGHRIGALEVFPDLAGDESGALFQHQIAVKILGVVLALFDCLAEFVELAFLGRIAHGVYIGGDADDLVGCKEAIFNALLQRVGVHRVAEIGVVADIFGFFGRGGEAQVRGTAKVVKHITPGRIFRCTATVAFVNDDQIKEIGRKLAIDLLPFFLTGHGLVERKVDLVVFLDLAIGDLVHHLAKWGEVLLHGLIDQDIAVDQEQDALLGFALPQPPNDLESGVGLAGAGGHDQQHALLPLGDHFNCTVDRHALVIARLAAAAVGMERLFYELDGFRGCQPFPLLIQRPQLIQWWKLVELQFALHWLRETCAVM